MIIHNITFDITAISGNGIIIAIVGYIIVFSALLSLYYVFSFIPKIIHFNIRQKLRKQGKHKFAEEKELNITGEVNAAISTALFMYFSELHDEENTTITIKKVSKTYSPWSSKIYGLRNSLR